MGNKGAFIRFEAPDLKPNIITFAAVVSIFPYFEACHVISFIVIIKNENGKESVL
jgi:hypothetical protein